MVLQGSTVTKGCSERERERERESNVARDAFARYIKLLLNFWCVYAIALAASFALQKHTFESVFCGDGRRLAVKYFLIDVAGMARLTDTPTFNSSWWYLSLASVLFILVPLMNYLYNRIGNLLIPIALLLPIMIPSPSNVVARNVLRYLLGVCLALCAERGNWFEDWKSFVSSSKTKIPAVFSLTGCLILLYFMRTSGYLSNPITENLVAFIVALIVTAVCGNRILLPLGNVLNSLGKYSMNIYLLHVFIMSYFFKTWTYSFGYPLLIFAVLMIECFAASFILEKLKGFCGFYKLQDGVARRIEDIGSAKTCGAHLRDAHS